MGQGAGLAKTFKINIFYTTSAGQVWRPPLNKNLFQSDTIQKSLGVFVPIGGIIIRLDEVRGTLLGNSLRQTLFRGGGYTI